MRNYALTERGKMLVAVLFMFILIMPSLILVIWLFSRDTTSNESPHGSTGIHQNENGLTASEPTPEVIPDPDPAQVSSTEDNSEPVSLDPSLAGPEVFDFSAGFLTFLFTPDIQTTLDDNTISILGALLASAQNTDDSMIAVEIPQLPDDNTAIITNAIISAFNAYEVPLSDIVFFVYQPEPDVQTYLITISFE